MNREKFGTFEHLRKKNGNLMILRICVDQMHSSCDVNHSHVSNDSNKFKKALVPLNCVFF